MICLGFIDPVSSQIDIIDILTNAPVQFDEFLVTGSHAVALSGLDEGKDFGELGV